MTDRDVRDLLQRAFEGIAERYGVHPNKSTACALEHLAALTGHGIRLVRPAHLHDPDADYRAATLRRQNPDQIGAPRAETGPGDLYYATRLAVTGNPPAGAEPPPDGQLEIPLDSPE